MSYGVATQTGVSVAIQSIPSMSANKGLRNGYGATFAENFADGTNVLDPRITFSRASNATVTNSSGYIVNAPHNLLTYSEQFDNAVYAKVRSTISANTTASPDGTTTADKFVEDSSASTTHIIRIDQSVTTGLRYTLSIYAKAAERTQLQMSFGNDNSAFASTEAIFTLSGTGSSLVVSGSPSPVITDVGNGWYRCSITSTATATATGAMRLFLAVSNSATYTGNGTSGIYIWGSQLEIRSSASTYNSTTVKNLLGYSEAFDNAAWTKTNSSISATKVAAPNGTVTGQKIVEDTATSTHYTRQQLNSTINTTPYTLTIYAKAGERTQVGLAMQETGAFTRQSNVDFNLSTGVAGTVSNIGGSSGTASMTDVGNGWYRCTLTTTLGGVATGILNWVYISTPSGFTYTGNGTSGIYIWGAQVSDAASVTPYVNNPVAAPSAAAYYGARFDYDPITLQPKGLLIEEQRTNLILQSEDYATTWTTERATVSTNTTTSPAGLVNADSVTQATAQTTSGSVLQSVSVTATTYSTSIYAKPNGKNFLLIRETALDGTLKSTWFNISTGIVGTTASGHTASMTAVGNGWYRCNITFTANGSRTGIFRFGVADTDGSTTVTDSGGIFLWGAQVEAGAFATSYIPTVASQVTRSADVALIQGSNFSGWYNATEGTIFNNAGFGNAPFVGANRFAGSISINDATSNNYIGIGYTVLPGSSLRYEGGDIFTAGVAQTGLGNVQSVAENTSYKIALAYKLNNTAVGYSGNVSATDTSVTLPTVTQMQIGVGRGGAYLNGYIKSIAYYPTRLQNSQLQAITQ